MLRRGRNLLFVVFMTIATFLAPSQCYYHYPLAGMKMWLFVVDSRAPCLALAAVIQLYAYYSKT